jgi:hypothetical protein
MFGAISGFGVGSVVASRVKGLGLGPVLSWAEGGLAFTVVEKAARIISESEGERIGIACGTPFDNAGGVRIGIHESLIV